MKTTRDAVNASSRLLHFVRTAADVVIKAPILLVVKTARMAFEAFEAFQTFGLSESTAY